VNKVDNLIRDIYIDILKYGNKYKTVDKRGNDVYIEYYARLTHVSYRYILKPKNTGR
jgi:hypothetical protein